MNGEAILVRSLTQQRREDTYGNRWQYNSQSDNHSKIACWAAMFDILHHSDLLRTHLGGGKVGFGINHSMTNPAQNESKKLDLVICTPRKTASGPSATLASLIREYGITLTDAEEGALKALPHLPIVPVASVLVAVESKACMTKHASNQRRQRGEFAESLDAILGAQQEAIAVAHAIVNASVEFVSPPSNRRLLSNLAEARISKHRQPRDTETALNGIRKLPIRQTIHDRGYDAVGATTIVARNDHSPITLASIPPALYPEDGRSYESMIYRIVHLYSQRFATL